MISVLTAPGAEFPVPGAGDSSGHPVGDGFLSILTAQMGEALPAETTQAHSRAVAEKTDTLAAPPQTDLPTAPDALLVMPFPPQAALLQSAQIAQEEVATPVSVTDIAVDVATTGTAEAASEAAAGAAAMLNTVVVATAAPFPTMSTAAVSKRVQALPQEIPVQPAAAGDLAAPAIRSENGGTQAVSPPSPVQEDETTRDATGSAVAIPVERSLPAMPAIERQALPPSFEAGLGESLVQIPRENAPPLTPVVTETGLARQLEQFTRPPAQVMHMTVEAPVRSPLFPTEFADKVVWMAGRQEQWADLTLNPANLGSVEVRLSLSGDSAGAQFFSSNPQVREALEAALPRLRELLGQAGIALQDASVHDQSLPQRHGSDARASWGTRPESRDEASNTPLSTVPRLRTGLGLVDLYA